MAPNASNLSDPKYGYDFVVSTTQESINAGMIEYLKNTQTEQPYSYFCFLANEDGDPVERKSLDEILTLSGGVNPFNLPGGTDVKDPRIQKLTEIRFVCGIRMQCGIPPGMMVDLPNGGQQVKLPQPIVTLGKTADNVLFNMYCSDVAIVRNKIPSGWGAKGSWQWFSQMPGAPWYVQTRTSLVVADLDKDLKTPYFLAHPAEREALRQKLVNLSGSAFSLQQLLFNLDSAITQTTPKFQGVDDEGVQYLLGMSFVQLWSTIAKERGLPLIGISAVAQHPDGSPLRVTGLERWVSPIVDSQSGITIQSPSDIQQSAATLNYLCVTDGHPMPGSSSFNWNWIEPKDLAESSGVIAIKRGVIASYLVQQILPAARKACIKPWTHVDAYNVVGGVDYKFDLFPGQEPTVTVTTLKDAGPVVAKIDYTFTSPASDSNAATYGELDVTSTYSCNILFGTFDFSGDLPRYVAGNKFSIIQSLKIIVYIQWARTSSTANVVDKTLTDEYVISVDSNGSLGSKHTGKSTITDKSTEGDASSFENLITRVNDMTDRVKNHTASFVNAWIAGIPFDDIKNFVFPGAKVFSYKTAAFSDYQDLVSLITYVNPTDDQFDPPGARVLSEVEMRPTPTILDEVPPLAAYIMETRASEIDELERKYGKKAPSNPQGLADPSVNIESVEKEPECN